MGGYKAVWIAVWWIQSSLILGESSSSLLQKRGREVVSFFKSSNFDPILFHYSIIPENQKVRSLEVFVKDHVFAER